MSDTFRKIVKFPVGIETTKTAVSDVDIPNKFQVLSWVNGLAHKKEAVATKTDANIDLATVGLAEIAGYQLLDQDRVLVTDQTDASQNGIYIASAGAWTRSLDADATAELKPYSSVFVVNGTHAGHKYTLQSLVDIIVGTTDQVWIHEAIVHVFAPDIATEQGAFTQLSGANVQDVLDSADDEFQAIVDQRYQSEATDLAQDVAVDFVHGKNNKYLSSIIVYNTADDADITSTLTVSAFDADTIRITNADVTTVNVVVVARV